MEREKKESMSGKERGERKRMDEWMNYCDALIRKSHKFLSLFHFVALA